ncbi:MAG: thiol:disulfide interchange protein DsbA/DsbL [Betaproteobacteria bacterium]
MHKWFMRVGLLLMAALAVSTANAQAGVTPVNPPQPVENDGKVEVLEVFAYGCIHCAELESSFEAWRKKQAADVKVKRIPTPAAIMGIDSSVLYYTLEALGQIDRLHPKIFEAIHLQKAVLGNPAELSKWLEKNGVDPKKYEAAQSSFSVVTKANRARQIVIAYQIHSTPTLIVNGRNLVVEQKVGGIPAMFATVDQLIGQARATVKAASAPAITKSAVK